MELPWFCIFADQFFCNFQASFCKLIWPFVMMSARCNKPYICSGNTKGNLHVTVIAGEDIDSNAYNYLRSCVTYDLLWLGSETKLYKAIKI